MMRVTRTENLLIVYSKHFLFFEWKLKKSDLRFCNVLRSSEFNLGGAKRTNSFLEIGISGFSSLFCYLHNSKSFGNGYYVLTVCDKNGSCIKCIRMSNVSFAGSNKIDLCAPDIIEITNATEYPIIVSCTVKSSNNNDFPILNVKHEERRDEISSDLMMVLEEGLNTDIELTTAEESIKAHRIILQARSPVFYKMFSHDSSEAAKNSVAISDIGASTLKKLVIFLYTGQMEKCSFDEAMELYYASDKYEVMSLRDDCREELLKNLDVNNACSLFSLANRHSDEDLRNGVVQLVSAYFKSVVNSESIKDMTKDDIILLMRLCFPSIKKE